MAVENGNPRFYGSLLICLALGIVLRLIWPWDMEWKADEKLMFSMAQDAVQSSKLPYLGMDSGVGLKNAGFSVWPFAAFYMLATTPVGMTFIVMLVNALALGIMFHNARQMQSHKEVFLAGTVLVSVNVLMVIFSRKLWAQDVMPIFTAMIWFLHLKRERLWTFFFLGVLSALAGQLHISGFFYAFGLFAAMMMAKQFKLKSLALYGMGFLIGILPALHWIQSLILGGHTSNTSGSNIFKFEYFLHAAIDPLGINLKYSLGDELIPMVKHLYFLPLVAGMIIVAATVYSIIVYLRSQPFMSARLKWNNPIFFYGMAFVLIPGLLLTFSGSPIRSHYLIGAAPFLQIMFAKLWLKAGKKVLFMVMISQLILSVLFLWYVHHSTMINGDYGVPFKHQI